MLCQVFTLIEGSFYSIESLSLYQSDSGHRFTHSIQKNQSFSKKFKIDGAASTIGGCIRE
jgi:aspartate 1-decarboxylase